MSYKVAKKHTVALIVLLVLASSLAIIKYTGYVFAAKTDRISAVEDTMKTVADEPADFTLSASAYGSDGVTAISGFEKGDGWTGNGVFDNKIFYEGSRSLSVVSNDRKPAVATLEKTMDLSAMDHIELMVHVENADAFEAAGIDFGDKNFDNFYSYPLSGLKAGWNLVQAPKDKFVFARQSGSNFNWSTVEAIRFTLLSRPNAIFLVRLDMLRSVNGPGDFLDHWRSTQREMFMSLYVQNGKPSFFARNIGTSIAVIKDVENVSDFVFSASISPQLPGRSGLFIRGNYSNAYGYYFLIGGDKRNTWQISKKNEDGKPLDVKVKGTMDNAVFSKDNKYWLRVEARGNLMKFYFSFDGRNYKKLGELTDGELQSGSVGVAVLDNGWDLLDDFRFQRL